VGQLADERRCVGYQWDWDKREISAIPIPPRELHLGRLLKSGTAIAVSAE